MTREDDQLGRDGGLGGHEGQSDGRKEKRTTLAYSTEGNTRNRGTEAVQTRTSTELPGEKRKAFFWLKILRSDIDTIYSW